MSGILATMKQIKDLKKKAEENAKTMIEAKRKMLETMNTAIEIQGDKDYTFMAKAKKDKDDTPV